MRIYPPPSCHTSLVCHTEERGTSAGAYLKRSLRNKWITCIIVCQKKKRKFLMNKNTAYSASANVCLPESKLSFSHPSSASGNALQHYFYSSKENIPQWGMKIALCAENAWPQIFSVPANASLPQHSSSQLDSAFEGSACRNSLGGINPSRSQA